MKDKEFSSKADLIRYYLQDPANDEVGPTELAKKINGVWSSKGYKEVSPQEIAQLRNKEKKKQQESGAQAAKTGEADDFDMPGEKKENLSHDEMLNLFEQLNNVSRKIGPEETIRLAKRAVERLTV